MKKAILELGGNINRLDTVLELVKQYPDALIIISSEGDPKGCLAKLKAAGISKDRFILDYQAWDTVTNFTTTLPIIRDQEIADLYVVTDLFHIPRAQAICESVYLFRGVVKHYVAHGTDDHKETIWYDTFRALLWRFTGYLLYDKSVKDQRMPGIEADAKLAEELLKSYEV
ncbi:hypothetical protein PQC13_gp279 [Synechococcus phage S-SRM01]|uniref:DUF218 domain-containing protein n=1 Tax=Synechococcus phage S-SRM01 TaxID=2781608 RepID=A0A879R232_9CAUD|nr:hypothetical protein PQC13_gp279 [Synechococcus phage S-SRM01]QPX48244.1 hypothetical protein [Synechococcus phage S-SRM01]